ncbi:MAG: selenocysteine-specific translation elongation factor, partial [Longimicrobiales bacterium]|nr:selenocysteine-specific translation elongation factor [Longimicrobiales bacterium]
MTRRLILGTAGHIDHGKTALVRALTGVDTDRLAEEKARGITIDLGFAELADDGMSFGVVDVPGHEGFVRNMLAGITGIDLALLVVAAEEGVMPQTREHVAILDLLGVRRVIVALTKVDLVEPEWVDLVEEEVRELLEPTGFAAAPMVRTSVESGEGIEALRRGLREAAEVAEAPDEDDVTLLPVDRVFTVRGTGTVVTGTLVSGRIRVGEGVRVIPGGLEARVRGLQLHGGDVEVAGAGARVAVALAGEGVAPEAVERGRALVTEPLWEASSMLTVRVRVLPDTGWS